MSFVVAEEVEVFGRGKGLEGSYHPAQVIEVLPNNRYRVRYDNLLQNDSNEPLQETLPGKRLRPRPFPIKFDEDFHKGDVVDVKHKDAFWKGVVTKFDGAIYRVKFEQYEGVWEYGANKVRIHQEWENGKWSYVKV